MDTNLQCILHVSEGFLLGVDGVVKRAIVLQHATFEGPARLSSLLSERGYLLDIRRLERGDRVPDKPSRSDLLIVMGGPMGISDLERPEFSFLEKEVRLLQRCVDRDAPVLGICLGAQLLAFAADASVRPMTDKNGERCYEVGWGPVGFHSSGESDLILRGVPQEPTFLHWHGDQFELPAGSRLLASTSRCPPQAFQLGMRMFGLQFHCEVDAAQVTEFLENDGDFVTRANGLDGAEQIRRDTSRHMAQSRVVGDRLLGNILDAMIHDS